MRRFASSQACERTTWDAGTLLKPSSKVVESEEVDDRVPGVVLGRVPCDVDVMRTSSSISCTLAGPAPPGTHVLKVSHTPPPLSSSQPESTLCTAEKTVVQAQA